MLPRVGTILDEAELSSPFWGGNARAQTAVAATERNGLLALDPIKAGGVSGRKQQGVCTD
jgi:hypothetical protein